MDSRIRRFIGTGCLSGIDKVLSLVSHSLPYFKNASAISTLYINGQKKICSNPVSISIEPYIFKNPVVLKITDYLKSNLEADLSGAFVHGSTGTDEIIPYSDFDGLLIIRDDVLSQPSRLIRLSRHLRITEKMMFELDPLQHHGWMLLAENDLQCYDESFFPHELFAHSKSLLPGGTNLTLHPDKNSDLKKPFLQLAVKLGSKLNSPLPQTLFGMKSMLSEFMLMPALYIQAKTGKGIFKKFSFDEAKKDFTPEQWECMNSISSIRNEWNFKADPGRELKAMRWKKIPVIADKCHEKIPAGLLNRILPLAEPMRKLLTAMKTTISS